MTSASGHLFTENSTEASHTSRRLPDPTIPQIERISAAFHHAAHFFSDVGLLKAPRALYVSLS